MILVNFKLYRETFGDGAIKLAKICKKVAEETGIKIIPVVSALDAYRIKNEVDTNVVLQHTDEYEDGPRSGYISAVQAQKLGVSGSLINHSEHQLPPGTIKKQLKYWPDKFMSVVCVQTLGQTLRWAKHLKTDYIAYEPKGLIGNRQRSVSSEQPEAIKKIVDYYGQTPVLVGAGIHSKADVETAIKLGAKGILVATDVIKAEDAEKELRKLTEGFGQTR